MKVLIDMNLSPKWVKALEAGGIEAVHWSNVGAANSPDKSIMQYARDHGFIVLTSDLDFGIALAMDRTSTPSVVQLRAEDLRPEILGDLVSHALKQMQEELTQGALVTIEPKRTRLRILPLHRG